MTEKSNLRDVTVENNQTDNTKVQKQNPIKHNSTKGNYSNANKDDRVKINDDVNKNDSKQSGQGKVEDVKTEKDSNKTKLNNDDDENYLRIGYFSTQKGVPEEVKLHVDEINDSEDEGDTDDHNLPYHFTEKGSMQILAPPKNSNSKKIADESSDLRTFSVGNFLMDDGTIEEVRISLEELEADDSEDSKDEDFDELNIPHHFDEDGSIQKLVLPQISSSKKIVDKSSDLRTFSVGNFLKEDGTIEEVRISLEELESDNEGDSKVEDFDELNIPHHFEEDGSIQKLIQPKTSNSLKIANGNSDSRTFSVGNFLKEDGTIEEVRVSLDDLESDDEEDSEEADIDELNIPHHFDEDGSIQKLVLPKKSNSKKVGGEKIV